jgi:hypothetical protein
MFFQIDFCKHGMPMTQSCGQCVDEARKLLDNLNSTVDEAFTVLKKKECECGSKKIGIKDFEAGHSSWCPVSKK